MNRLSGIFDKFKGSAKQQEVTKETMAKAVNAVQNEIVKCAVILNQLLRPGATEIVVIQQSKIITSGRPAMPGGIIVISKSTATETLNVEPGKLNGREAA